MSFPTIDTLLKKINNKFLLSNALAWRAKEISEGSIPFVEDYNPINPIETAMKELSHGKFSINILKGPIIAKVVKVVEEKAKDFWTIDSLEKKDHKKVKKTTSSKKK